MTALLFLLLLTPASPCNAEKTPITVALIGDSTVTDQSGWGKAFAGRFKGNVTVLNFSVGGRSSKSWYDEGRLPKVLAAKPDYVLIQFGHNDQPGKGPKRETDPATTYRDFLRMYVKEFRKIGAEPILVSSVARRQFDDSGKICSTLGPWAEGAKAVAQEMNVTLVDLYAASVAYHNKIGRQMSMEFNPKEGDISHFNAKGAEAIVDLIVKEVEEKAKGLATYLKQADQ